jgi:hypothetical protein
VEAESHDGIEVPCLRADQVCQELGVVPDIVKVDVEGLEFDVLRGFDGFLQSIAVLLVEMNGLSDQRGSGRAVIHRWLASRGLKGPYQCLFDQKQLRPLPNRHREDHIYLSANMHEQLVQSGWVVKSLS